MAELHASEMYDRGECAYVEYVLGGGVAEPVERMAIWRDARGVWYRAPAGDYAPGQFSPTGSQLLSFCKQRGKRA